MKYLLLACLCLLTNCGPSQDPLVAEVGPHQISARLLHIYVEELSPGLRTKKTGDEARQHYLQALIDRRLLLMEARSRGLDTTSAFLSRIQEAVDSRVRSIYRTQEIGPKVKIPNEAVRRYFEAEGYGRERLLNAILVASRAAADTVLQELEAGRSFEEVARTRSQDERSTKRGGELGFVGRDMLDLLYIPPEVFNNLAQDQLTVPLPAGPAWHIVRFTEDRPATYEKYQAKIARLLYRERLVQVETELLEQLRESFEVRLDPAGLRELVDAFAKRQPTLLEGSPTILYTYDGGEITVGQVQRHLRQLNLSYGFADSARAVVFLNYHFLKSYLFQEAAHKAGLYKTSEIQQFTEQTTEDVLLEALRKYVIADSIDVSEEEVRTYYDTHLETFRHSEAMWVEEVLLPSRAEALEIRAEIEAGAPFTQFVDRSVREDARKYDGVFHFHKLGKSRYPVLIPAVFQAPHGQLEGPLEVTGGYSVFRVLRREDSGIEPFETARWRARALLRLEHETQALNALLVQLREKYAAQIKIYPAHLREAVPESLLEAQSLGTEAMDQQGG